MLRHFIIILVTWTSTLTMPFQLPPEVDMEGPSEFIALGGPDLRIRYRLGPTSTAEGNGKNLVSKSDVSSSWQIQLALDNQIIASRNISSISSEWRRVTFPCGLIVVIGQYLVHLVHVSHESDHNGGEGEKVVKTIGISVSSPKLMFEVPKRLEAYTVEVPVSVSLTGSPCKSLVPLPSTGLFLSICKAELETINHNCTRNFAQLSVDPFNRLQRDGRESITVPCDSWGKNATFRVRMVQTNDGEMFAQSAPIRVDWGSRFSVQVPGTSVFPCRNGSLSVLVTRPACIARGRDKLRVFGYETLTAPSHLAPYRVTYLGEKQVKDAKSFVRFQCNFFPSRFFKFCFQYVNKAVDESVSIVLEKCVSSFPVSNVSLPGDGWGPWSPWSPCSTTCGSQGRRFRYRICESGSTSLSPSVCQGEATEEQACDNLSMCLPPPADVINANSDWIETSTVETGSQDYDDEMDMDTHRWPWANISVVATLGCECGCILSDLEPDVNYTVAVYLSSNQTEACWDWDMHNDSGIISHHIDVDKDPLHWTLQAKDDDQNVRLELVAVDVHCVHLDFRDGVTRDSNLLQIVGSSSRPRNVIDLNGHSTSALRVTSSSNSLSLVASESNDEECSPEFLYFIAIVRVVPANSSWKSMIASLPWVSSEFWMFLFLKIVLVCFTGIILCSTVAGFLTQMYRKHGSMDGCEDSEAFLGGSERDGIRSPDDRSRCTSVTIMSFDYAYWKRLRNLRIKTFLLRHKAAARTQQVPASVPSTPVKVREKNFMSCTQQRNLNRRSMSDTNVILVSQLSPKGIESNNAKMSITSNPQKCATASKTVEDEKKQKESVNRKLQRLEHEDDELRGHQMTSGTRLLRLPLDVMSSGTQLSDTTESKDSGDIEDPDLDLEMDYYDYDVLKAGNIPGSYLGLEPTFVVWNADLFPHEDIDHEDSTDLTTATEMVHLSSTLSTSTSGALSNDDDDNSYDDEVTRPLKSKDESFDTLTLKFADDEDAEEETTT